MAAIHQATLPWCLPMGNTSGICWKRQSLHHSPLVTLLADGAFTQLKAGVGVEVSLYPTTALCCADQGGPSPDATVGAELHWLWHTLHPLFTTHACLPLLCLHISHACMAST
jgi:hypothetical protein